MSHREQTLREKLFDAAWKGDVAALAALLTEGRSLPPRALDSALEAAAYNAKPDAVEFLLRNGANSNTVNLPTGESVLHQAIIKTSEPAERTRIIKLLIAAGADVNVRTVPGITTECFMRDIRTRGETPLHRAAAFGDVEMIHALVDAGADRSAKDAHGESPLTWASWHLRDTPVLKLLLYGEFEGSLR
jgi:cytohesin